MNMVEAIFLFISTQNQLLLSWSAHLPFSWDFAQGMSSSTYSKLPYPFATDPIPSSGIGRGEGAKAFDKLEGDLMCLLYLHRWTEMQKQQLRWESAGTIDRFHLKMGERKFPIHEDVVFFSCRNRK